MPASDIQYHKCLHHDSTNLLLRPVKRHLEALPKLLSLASYSYSYCKSVIHAYVQCIKEYVINLTQQFYKYRNGCNEKYTKCSVYKNNKLKQQLESS